MSKSMSLPGSFSPRAREPNTPHVSCASLGKKVDDRLPVRTQKLGRRFQVSMMPAACLTVKFLPGVLA